MTHVPKSVDGSDAGSEITFIYGKMCIKHLEDKEIKAALAQRTAVHFLSFFTSVADR